MEKNSIGNTSAMENFKPLPDPHSHFATFSKVETQSGEDRFKELQGELRRMAHIVNTGPELHQCGTIQHIGELPVINPQTGAEEHLLFGYYVVPGNLLEVALIACEMVKQQMENERIARLTGT